MRLRQVLLFLLFLLVPPAIGGAETNEIQSETAFQQINRLQNDQLFQKSEASVETATVTAKFSTEELFKQAADFSKHELVIKFRDNLTQEEKNATLEEVQLVEKSTILGTTITLVEITTNEDIARVATRLIKHKNIDFVEPNYQVEQKFTPKDPSYYRQWYLNQVQMPRAWDMTRGASNITVAVIDGGVQKDHPDLVGKIVKPYNAVTGGTSYAADDHGTHVAGIIAASMDNKGIAGIAPNVKIMPINVFTGKNTTSYDILNGIYYAANNKANVINMSLGGFGYSYYLELAANYAYLKGCVLVAAAGNSDTHYHTYPAALPAVIAVSATNPNDRITDFSNYGNYIDFAAPGRDIFSTVTGSSYSMMSGTSMASPIVSGVAALILSKNPLLSPLDVKRILAYSAVDLGERGWDIFYGYGRVNAYRALELTPLPLTEIKTSSDTFTMRGDNRYAMTFNASPGTNVSLFITNQNGTIVRRVINNQPWNGGKVTALWDGKMDKGIYVASGQYKVVAKVTNGAMTLSKTITLNVVDKVVPAVKFTQTSQYFSPVLKERVSIPFELNKKAVTTATIYDKSGNKLRTLVANKSLEAGKQSFIWNGKNTNGARVKDGAYQIVVTTVSGKLTGPKRTSTILVDSTKPSTSFDVSSSVFIMDGTGVMKGQIKLSEKVKASAYVVNKQGVKVKRLVHGQTYQQGTASLNWDGRTNQNTFSEEGQYHYLLQLTDNAGNQATIKSSPFALQDWQKPVIKAVGEAEWYGHSVTLPYHMTKTGRVTVEIYQGTQLIQTIEKDMDRLKGENEFEWDAANFADGQYSYKITLQDKYNQRTSLSGEIIVVFTKIEVEYPEVVSYKEDDEMVAEVYFKLSQPAYLTIEIFNQYGGKVRSLTQDEYFSQGAQSFAWDGTNDIGYFDYGSEYTYVITAKGETGQVTTVKGKISKTLKPTWLTTHGRDFTRDIKGNNISMNLRIEVTQEITAYLFAYSSLVSQTPLEQKEYKLKVGENKITYQKPTKDVLYYSLVYIDHLGNSYYYYTDEY